MIFADVDAKERFVVLGLRGADAKTGEQRGFLASIMNWSVEEARSRPRQQFTFEILKTLNPAGVHLVGAGAMDVVVLVVLANRAHDGLED